MQLPIEVTHLTKDFGHGRGIFDVNFTVRPGEVLGFLGPNGAGKTTTIRHLIGFTKPGAGQVRVAGYDATTAYHRVMETVGYLPGEVTQPEKMNVHDFLQMMVKLKRVKDQTSLTELSQRFSLTNLRGPLKKLSLGEKRKLAVVVALMNDPAILILDEPTSGLDPLMQDQFIDLMVEEKQRGKTILLSSHIFKEVEALCDRIVIIKDGRLIQEVGANQLKQGDQRTYRLEFATVEAARQANHKLHGQQNQTSVTVTVPKQNLNELTSQLATLAVCSLEEQRFDLEKYFLDFYRTDKHFATL